MRAPRRQFAGRLASGSLRPPLATTDLRMNPASTPPPVTPPPSQTRWLGIALVLLLLPVIPLGGLALGVASYFRLSADTRALRDELTQASGAEWHKKIGLNIGNLTLGVARGALQFTQLEPEAQTALRAARGVEVGIYELAPDSRTPDCAAMLNAADEAMRRRGWERVVGVLDGAEMVGVFLPAKMTSASRAKCCVVVLDDRNLVLVTGGADLQPLLELAQNKTGWRTKLAQFASN